MVIKLQNMPRAALLYNVVESTDFVEQNKTRGWGMLVDFLQSDHRRM